MSEQISDSKHNEEKWYSKYQAKYNHNLVNNLTTLDEYSTNGTTETVKRASVYKVTLGIY